jgi:hypothetical protein
MRDFNLRERAEIVSIAQECSKSLSAQPLIDYFNRAYKTKFENNGTTIVDTIINKYFPECNDTFRETIHMLMLDYTFSFESCRDREDLHELFRDFFIFHNEANKITSSVDVYFNEWYDARHPKKELKEGIIITLPPDEDIDDDGRYIGNDPQFFETKEESKMVRCSTCEHCKIISPAFDDPHGTIYCGKKHWENSDGSDLDDLITCSDFEPISKKWIDELLKNNGYTANLQPMRCKCHPSLPRVFINRFCTRCGGTEE